MPTEESIDLQLHRYFDGDLSPAEAESLRHRLAEEPELSRKLEALAELRELVRGGVEAELGDIDSESMWAKIERGLEHAAEGEELAPASSVKRLKAIDGARAGGEVSTPRAAPVRARPSRPGRVIAVVTVGLALAAAVLLAVLRPWTGSNDAGTTAQRDETPSPSNDDPPELAPAEPTAEEIVLRTEVLAVDFGDNTGAIFALEGDGGERYAVVWLADVQPKPAVVEQ